MNTPRRQESLRRPDSPVRWPDAGPPAPWPCLGTGHPPQAPEVWPNWCWWCWPGASVGGRPEGGRWGKALRSTGPSRKPGGRGAGSAPWVRNRSRSRSKRKNLIQASVFHDSPRPGTTARPSSSLASRTTLRFGLPTGRVEEVFMKSTICRQQTILQPRHFFLTCASSSLIES